MITGNDLKRRIFSTNKFDKKEVKSLIACKNILYLRNRLKSIEQTINQC